MVKLKFGGENFSRKTFGGEILEGEKFGGEKNKWGKILVVKSTVVTMFGSAKIGGEIHHTR